MDNFISASDRIISAAIDIISDAGLASLTIPIISMRTNLSEMMIYKYFTNTDEILDEVVATYFRFDNGIFKTLSSRDSTNIEKLSIYVDAYGSYYNSYYSLSAIMLQYEELLHNTKTREKVEQGYLYRREGLKNIFQDAIQSGEISDIYTADNLADMLLGIFIVTSLNRRVMQRKKSYKEEISLLYTRWIDTITKK